MYKTVLLLLLLVTNLGATQTSPQATNSASRILILENSTMAFPTAKATLIIGPLTCSNHVYVGDFKVKVFPYFFKNDWGRLAINVPDTALTALNQGRAASVTGTSTSLKKGTVRQIEITATPIDRNHGNVSLWFLVKDQKMIFTPAYHFTSNESANADALAQPLNRRR